MTGSQLRELRRILKLVTVKHGRANRWDLTKLRGLPDVDKARLRGWMLQKRQPVPEALITPDVEGNLAPLGYMYWYFHIGSGVFYLGHGEKPPNCVHLRDGIKGYNQSLFADPEPAGWGTSVELRREMLVDLGRDCATVAALLADERMADLVDDVELDWCRDQLSGIAEMARRKLAESTTRCTAL